MKEIGVDEVRQILETEQDVTYLDVRSIPEFEQGHPPRALNIPLMHFQSGMGMSPNPDFLKIAEANLSKDARILVGCRSGGRSSKACEILTKAGFNNVVNVREGFVGQTDPTGRVVAPGWSLRDFPECQDCPPDSHYEHLAKNTK